jgi:hypothetical protein
MRESRASLHSPRQIDRNVDNNDRFGDNRLWRQELVVELHVVHAKCVWFIFRWNTVYVERMIRRNKTVEQTPKSPVDLLEKSNIADVRLVLRNIAGATIIALVQLLCVDFCRSHAVIHYLVTEILERDHELVRKSGEVDCSAAF